MEAIPVMRHKLGHYLGSGYPRFKNFDFITKASKMWETWLEMELEGKLTGRQELTPTKRESKQDYWVDVDVDMSIGPQFEPSVLIGANEGVAEPLGNNVGKKRKRRYKGPDVPAQRRQRMPLKKATSSRQLTQHDSPPPFPQESVTSLHHTPSASISSLKKLIREIVVEEIAKLRSEGFQHVERFQSNHDCMNEQDHGDIDNEDLFDTNWNMEYNGDRLGKNGDTQPGTSKTVPNQAPQKQYPNQSSLKPPHHSDLSPHKHRNVGIETCVTQTFFKTLEDPNEWLSNEHVDAYINVLYKRKNDLSAGEHFSKHDAVLDCNFFSDLHERLARRFVSAKFEVLVDWISYAIGEQPLWSTHWANVEMILVPCRVDNGHWVLGKVNLLTWVITIYDSVTYLKPTDDKFREEQVLPLWRLFPLICNQSGYYEVSKSAPRKPLDCMKAVRLSLRQFPQQHDGTSCGIFMLQGIENIMRNKDQQ
ncbi:hypothetical protein Ddye_001299 [Dipteronia dyeriana]|uniref:Ubiquitin-like protease family profile domain-containing protein n=1 Tax=Dipteronia dyeriana TaxID=168575 RepID=A0AAE0CT67_9ROSI|nr:hypothetical protein Ddye_001299 [Dipteronia dyeriana]